MSTSVEEVFADNELIGSPCRLLSEYRFSVGQLSPMVTIKLYEDFGGRIYFEQSHFIKTPLQADIYQTTHNFGDDEGDALRRAINTLVDFYEEAVAAGHEPDESWLVPNEHWHR